MAAAPFIPRPWSQRWKDFRLRLVPFLAFVVGAAGVFMLWDRNWAPSNFVGEVQGKEVTLTAPQAGVIEDLSVGQLDPVAQGQTLCKIRLRSPDSLKTALAVLRADLGVQRTRMIQDEQRIQLNYQQLRADLLQQRVELASARASLRYAEDEVRRSETLVRDGVLSAGEFDLALDRRDMLQAQVAELTVLIEEIGATLEATRPAGPAARDPLILDTIEAAIEAQEDQLLETEGPSSIRAPIDGLVSRIDRRDGEFVAEGDAILSVAGTEPDRIIGFIRQPITFEPRTNDLVEVRTRGQRSQRGLGRITHVGSRLELFTQPLRVRGFDSSLERGLPVLVELPKDMTFFPGELVDLVLRAEGDRSRQ